MKLYLPITVDLYNTYPLAVMNAQQYNTGRGALVTLTAGGSVIVPDAETLYIYAKKSDGTVVYANCSLIGNQIQVDYDEQMLAIAEKLQMELQMVDGDGNSVTTPIYMVNVQPSNIDYKKITSSDEFLALTQALADVEELKKNGLKGDKGDAATIQIGTVSASDPGGDPAVTNSGTSGAAVFNFVLPRGLPGPKGDPGDVTNAINPTGATEADTGKAADAYYTGLALSELTGKMSESQQYKLALGYTGISTSTSDAQIFDLNYNILQKKDVYVGMVYNSGWISMLHIPMALINTWGYDKAFTLSWIYNLTTFWLTSEIKITTGDNISVKVTGKGTADIQAEIFVITSA